MLKSCSPCVVVLLLKLVLQYKELCTILSKHFKRELIESGSNFIGSLAGKEREKVDADYLDRELVNPEMTASQHEQPFCLVTQFAATESILENVASDRRVHLIDFSIDNGSHWTLIMQAFSARTECPLEHLKITAVGTCKPMMEVTGKWLSSFAETIHLPFSFNIVVSDLKNLEENFFEIREDEVVAVYSSFRLWSLLAWPNHLKALIKVIKSLKPLRNVNQRIGGEYCDTSILGALQ